VTDKKAPEAAPLPPNTGRFEISIVKDDLPEPKLQELEERIAKLTDFYIVEEKTRVRKGEEETIVVYTFDSAESFDIGPTVRAITTGAAKVSSRPAYVAWVGISGERFRP
jgi:hypothetical protein